MAAGNEILAKALKGNGALTALNLSGNRLLPAFIESLADAIPTMGALTSLNVSNNNIGSLVLPEGVSLPAGWSGPESDGDYKRPDGSYTWAVPGGQPLGVIALADGIKNIGALVKFDISNNALQAKGGKALAAGLKGQQTITELNLADNYLGVQDSTDNSDMSGVVAISNAIPTMGALVKLTMGNNSLKGTEAGKALGKAIAANTVLKELDLSSPQNAGIYPCDTEFTKEFAAGLGANGALTSLNLRNNRRIEPEGALALADAIEKNGARVVKVKGLKNARHLNGLTGIVQETLANARRVVELDNGERKSFKSENLETLGTRGALRVLDISHNSVGEAMWQIMRACRANDVKLIAEGIKLPKPPKITTTQRDRVWNLLQRNGQLKKRWMIQGLVRHRADADVDAILNRAGLSECRHLKDFTTGVEDCGNRFSLLIGETEFGTGDIPDDSRSEWNTLVARINRG